MDFDSLIKQLEEKVWTSKNARDIILKQQEWPLALQKRVLDEIIRHPRIVSFPPSPLTMFQFLKQLNDAVEQSGEEVEEGLVEEMMERISSLPKRPEEGGEDIVCHVSWRVPDVGLPDDIMTAKIRSSIKDVGLCVWDGGLFLIEFILGNPELFSERSVLELSSGIGTAGIALARLSPPPSRIVVSDYSAAAVGNMHTNFEINDISDVCSFAGDDEPDEQTGSVSTVLQHMPACPHLVHVLQIDWTRDFSDVVDATAPDIILAADTLYDPELAEKLPAAFLPLSERGCEIYLVANVRNEATFDIFLKGCQALDLIVTECDTTKRRNVFAYDASRIKLLSVGLAM